MIVWIGPTMMVLTTMMMVLTVGITPDIDFLSFLPFPALYTLPKISWDHPPCRCHSFYHPFCRPFAQRQVSNTVAWHDQASCNARKLAGLHHFHSPCSNHLSLFLVHELPPYSPIEHESLTEVRRVLIELVGRPVSDGIRHSGANS